MSNVNTSFRTSANLKFQRVSRRIFKNSTYRTVIDVTRRSPAKYLDKGVDIILISIILPGLARVSESAHLHINLIQKLSHLGAPARVSETARLTGLM